jgi:hypothetical protein
MPFWLRRISFLSRIRAARRLARGALRIGTAALRILIHMRRTSLLSHPRSFTDSCLFERALAAIGEASESRCEHPRRRTRAAITAVSAAARNAMRKTCRVDGARASENPLPRRRCSRFRALDRRPMTPRTTTSEERTLALRVTSRAAGARARAPRPLGALASPRVQVESRSLPAERQAQVKRGLPATRGAVRGFPAQATPGLRAEAARAKPGLPEMAGAPEPSAGAAGARRVAAEAA